MTTRVDGHSWALSAIDELKVDKIITPLNKDHIPITDSPVVVQQHMLPPKKFVLLSAQVCAYLLTVEAKEAVFSVQKFSFHSRADNGTHELLHAREPLNH